METLRDLLEHQKKYNERLYLIPSENTPSINARLAFLTDVLNRYYFPLKEHQNWAFPGNEHIERIYERCIELLREAAGAQYVSIKPISGVSAMTIALAALVKPGETIATISPENGGHGITTAIAQRLGLRVVYLPYDQTQFKIEISTLPEFIARERISLIYLNQAHVLFPFRLQEIRLNVPQSIPIYYDGSHTMGLIFGKQFQDPLREGATFLGGSTHKTIPGPHKAFIATNNENAFEFIKRYSKIFVSHDHGGDVAALAIVMEEMRGHWREYAAQVIKNSQAFARALDARGFKVAAKHLGFTQSHQIWIDVAEHYEPFEAVLALARCNIIINTIIAPLNPSRLALRIGVQELTYCGAKEDTVEEIADIFEAVLIKKEFSGKSIKSKVAAIKQRFLPPINREHLEMVIRSLFQ